MIMNANVLSENLSAEAKRNLVGTAELRMLWHCQSDPRFHYLIHIPEYYYERENQKFPLIVIVHGTGRDNTEYWAEAKKYADATGAALLAPQFPGGLVDPSDLNSYKLLNCNGIRYDQILLNMIDEMQQRFSRILTDRFFMFGFSGGGQFTNRFLFVHPDRLLAASIGAPGRPTYLNYDEDYFWGIRDFRKHFDKNLDLEEVRKVPVEIMVGDQDISYIGDSAYGTNRVERNRHLVKNLEEHGVNVQFDLLPGLNHISGRTEKMKTALAFFDQHR